MQCGKNVVILGAGPIGALVQNFVQVKEYCVILIHHMCKLDHPANLVRAAFPKSHASEYVCLGMWGEQQAISWQLASVCSLNTTRVL